MVILEFFDYSLDYLHKLLFNPDVLEYTTSWVFFFFVVFSIFKYINVFIHVSIYSTNVNAGLEASLSTGGAMAGYRRHSVWTHADEA